MKIDAHNHANWYFLTAEKMIENMDKNGIDKCFLLSCETPIDEIRFNEHDACYIASNQTVTTPFEYCLDFYNKYPNRFILGFAPDPRDSNALKRLKYAVDTFGVRVCGEFKYRILASTPDAIKLYRYAGEMGLPVTIHFDLPFPNSLGGKYEDIWYAGGIEELERVLKLCPDTNFLGHAPGFWSEISGDDLASTVQYPRNLPVKPNGKLLKLLDKYSNVYCDASAGSGFYALSRDREFGRKFVIDYQDRILFARDNMQSILDELIKSFNLPKEISDKIYYKNALKLIGEKE